MARIRGKLRAVPPAAPSDRAIAGSTLLVMFATLGSAVIGFLREVVSARTYGTQWEMDTFLAAAVIPTILFGLFNGALVSALVPVFTEYIATGRSEEAYRLASTIFNVLFVVLSVLAVLGYVYAPYYVPLVAHGFPAPQMGVAIHMTRWLVPSIVATSLAGVVSALLNAQHRFSASGLQGIAINVVTIVTVLALNPKLGIFALVLGTALGLTAQLIVQLPWILRYRLYRPVVDLRHPGLHKIAGMLGPMVIGSAAGQVALFFDRFFASTLSPGYMAGMNYATKLVGFPLQIFAAAIATVIFPLLASQFAASNRAGIRRSVVMGLRMVNFITVPAVCGLIVLAVPIVSTLFERGNFQASATQLCAGLLPYAALGLLAMAANVVLTRCCFACKEARLPVVISIATVIINVILSIVWLPTLGARGLLLANSTSQTFQTLALFILVWRLLHGLDWKTLAWSAARIAFCAALMVGALSWIASLGFVPAPTLAARACYLLAQLGIGAVIFFGSAALLRVEEMRIAAGMLVEKFERHVLSPPENREAPIA
ncbi:MAG TPA: murein biosynthesis integral membrane protein MurJ [Candidatus Acidoferrales bacterium]|nr:murein biosynthesis integral membrane protein MurJ [Candidatus Acidoferrales bacterium]